MISRLKRKYQAWRRRRRRKKAARGQEGKPLREFVYLDEVSVYSLLASRLGPVAAELTETESSSLLAEATGGAEVAAPGVGKAKLGSRLQTTETRGLQVVRKAIIQAQFKELIELETEHLVLSPPGLDTDPPKVASADDLLKAMDNGELDGWAIDPQRLERGLLLELEVELDAEAIFRVSAILSNMLEILEENPELIGADSRQGVLQAMTASRILDRLLVGLVPLRGRAVRFQAVTLGEREVLVHNALLDQLTTGEGGFSSTPVFLVGVAEERLFWRDLRTVLFARSRFTAMVRLGRDGLQDQWTPVKLADVLKDVVPQLGDLVDDAGAGLLDTMAQGGAAQSAEDTLKREALRNALVLYAVKISAGAETPASESDLEEAGLLSISDEEISTLEGRRKAFQAVTDHVVNATGAPLDKTAAAEERERALQHAGLYPDGTLAEVPQAPVARGDGRDRDRFLDAEVVAIYW